MSERGARSERPLESADFAASRVAGSRRRPPLAAFGWMAVLGSVIALGLGGRLGAPAGTGGAAVASGATEPTAATAGSLPASSIRLVEGTHAPRFDPDFPTGAPPDAMATSEPGPIALDATRNASSVFVHGDVFAEQVTWVYVSLQTLDGQVGGWASVSIPGAAAETNGRPALRFDVELAVPTGMAAGVLMVQANAYDVKGVLVASTRVRLAAEM